MAEVITPELVGGEAITRGKHGLEVPDHPIIPYIRGDFIGSDITPVMLKVVDAAVEKAYGGRRRIHWLKLYAGDEAVEHFHPKMTKEKLSAIPVEERQRYYLPDETVAAMRKYLVSIKGPLTTPVGGGIRSLNVALRILLDLYLCLRPVRWYGTPAPVKNPQDLDIVIFRENTEDVYTGIEWQAGTPEADKVIRWLSEEMGVGERFRFTKMCGIGVKPISKEGSQRLVRAAIDYAIKNSRKVVTLVHKGNIMKFTEGAFRDWGYEVAREDPRLITEEELATKYGGWLPDGKVLTNDRIADQFFQQLLLRPAEYDVIATTNLNGDYISDAAAAQVGGLGMAPSANINFETGVACFEPAHGTAPKYAGLDKANPSGLILSAVAMLRYIGWPEAAEKIVEALKAAILSKHVTYDLARQMEGATEVSCSAFGDLIIEMIERM